MSRIFHGLLWFLVLALFTGIVAYAYFRSVRRKIEALAESERQDLLLVITQFLTDELDVARISADAHGDTARLAAIDGWRKSLVDCAQALQQAGNADLEDKRAVTERSSDLLAEVRAQIEGSSVGTKRYDSKDVWVDNSVPAVSSPFVPERSIFRHDNGIAPPPVSPAYGALQPDFPRDHAGENSFFSALENGLGMGVGIEIAEDLMGGNRDSFGGDSSGSSFGGGFGGGNGDDNNGIDDGFSSGGNGGNGGTDDGLLSGDNGGTDDGLSSDDSGGTDDGFSSDDSSW